MRIVFVDFFSYALFNPTYPVLYGGAQVQLYQLELALAQKKDVEIHVIVKDFGQPHHETFEHIQTHSFSNRLPWYLNIPYLRVIPIALKLLRLLYTIRPNIIVNRAASPEVGVATFYAHLMGATSVYMIAHELDVSGEYVQKNGLVGRVYEYGLRSAGLIVAQSQDQATMLAQRYSKKAPVIPSVYTIPKTTLPFNQRDYVLWVARLERWKQPQYITQLAHAFPDQKFVVIAPNGNEDAVWTESIKKTFRQAKNIDYIPSVPFREIDDYFRRAKLFVNTSRYEGFPNTFVQAAKNGTPVVSFQVNPDDLLTRTKMGSYADGSPTQLNAAVKQLLSDQKAWQTASTNAYQYARSTHDIRLISQQYYDLFVGLHHQTKRRLKQSARGSGI